MINFPLFKMNIECENLTKNFCGSSDNMAGVHLYSIHLPFMWLTWFQFLSPTLWIPKYHHECSLSTKSGVSLEISWCGTKTRNETIIFFLHLKVYILVFQSCKLCYSNFYCINVINIWNIVNISTILSFPTTVVKFPYILNLYWFGWVGNAKMLFNRPQFYFQ